MKKKIKTVELNLEGPKMSNPFTIGKLTTTFPSEDLNKLVDKINELVDKANE